MRISDWSSDVCSSDLKGAATVAGAFGKAVEIQSRFKDVDLAIVNSFAPGLNIGGRATGSLDFSQPAGSSFPQADARLNIAGFTRTSLSAVSQPVDISVAGHLLPSGGDIGAVRAEEHTSELQSLMRISYAVFS